MLFRLGAILLVLAMALPPATTAGAPPAESRPSATPQTSNSISQKSLPTPTAKPAPQPTPAKASPAPSIKTATDQALARVEPALREKARAGGEEKVLVLVMARPGTKLNAYGQVISTSKAQDLGQEHAYLRVPAENLVEAPVPFQAKRQELEREPDLVWDILADGARRARTIAERTIQEVKGAIALPSA